MRRAARIDANQPDIVKALRRIGATVQPLHSVGSGCPDILCGYRGRNVLLEIKDGRKPPSARKLTPDERDWINGWAGSVTIVESIMGAIEAVTGEPFRHWHGLAEWLKIK